MLAVRLTVSDLPLRRLLSFSPTALRLFFVPCRRRRRGAGEAAGALLLLQGVGAGPQLRPQLVHRRMRRIAFLDSEQLRVYESVRAATHCGVVAV